MLSKATIITWPNSEAMEAPGESKSWKKPKIENRKGSQSLLELTEEVGIGRLKSIGESRAQLDLVRQRNQSCWHTEKQGLMADGRDRENLLENNSVWNNSVWNNASTREAAKKRIVLNRLWVTLSLRTYQGS